MCCGHLAHGEICRVSARARSRQVKYDLDLSLPALNCQVLFLRVQNEQLDVCGHRQALSLNSQPPFMFSASACSLFFSFLPGSEGQL